MTGFYIKRNTGLKWVNIVSHLETKKRVVLSYNKQHIADNQTL